LQLFADVLPEEATDKNVIWSVLNFSGEASIDASGLLTGIVPGYVTAVATANDGSGTYGTLDIEIDIQLPEITINRYEMIIKVPRRFLQAKISLLGLDGRILQTMKIWNSECRFDVSALTPGIYIISIHKSVILYGTKVFKPF